MITVRIEHIVPVLRDKSALKRESKGAVPCILDTRIPCLVRELYLKKARIRKRKVECILRASEGSLGPVGIVLSYLDSGLHITHPPRQIPLGRILQLDCQCVSKGLRCSSLFLISGRRDIRQIVS